MIKPASQEHADPRREDERNQVADPETGLSDSRQVSIVGERGFDHPHRGEALLDQPWGEARGPVCRGRPAASSTVLARRGHDRDVAPVDLPTEIRRLEERRGRSKPKSARGNRGGPGDGDRSSSCPRAGKAYGQREDLLPHVGSDLRKPIPASASRSPPHHRRNPIDVCRDDTLPVDGQMEAVDHRDLTQGRLPRVEDSARTGVQAEPSGSQQLPYQGFAVVGEELGTAGHHPHCTHVAPHSQLS